MVEYEIVLYEPKEPVTGLPYSILYDCHWYHHSAWDWVDSRIFGSLPPVNFQKPITWQESYFNRDRIGSNAGVQFTNKFYWWKPVPMEKDRPFPFVAITQIPPGITSYLEYLRWRSLGLL